MKTKVSMCDVCVCVLEGMREKTQITVLERKT